MAALMLVVAAGVRHRRRAATPQPLDDTFSMLRGRVNDQGGFGLWSSSPNTAEFPTVYAAHFLIEAKERGQKIPPES